MTILQRCPIVGAATCQKLIDIYDYISPNVNEKDYSGFPVVHCSTVLERQFVKDIVNNCHITIAEHFNENMLLPETVTLNCLGPGGWHPRHADNARQQPDGTWVPNHTPQRDLSAILYLNDGFKGGKIFFDRQMEEIQPKTGMLVAFPSTSSYPHEVRLVTHGRRYSLAMWFTLDPKHALPGWPSLDGVAR